MTAARLIVGRFLPVALPSFLFLGLLLLVLAGNTVRLLAAYGAETYGRIAQNLLHHGLYSIDGVHLTAIRPPAYPLFLAGLMAPGGTVLVLVAQALVAAACVGLTALIARRLFADPVVTTLAAVLVAGNPWLLGEFLSPRETGLFTLVTLLYVLAVLAGPRGVRFVLILSALSALAMLTRPSGLVFVPVSFLLLAYPGQAETQRSVRECVVYVIVLALLLAPWQVYLYRSFDRVAPGGTSTSGMNLFKGNHPVMGEIYTLADVDRADPLIVDLAARAGFDWRADQWRADDYLQGLAVASIADNPVRFVRRAAEKAVAFWSPVPVPVGKGGAVRLEDGRLIVVGAEAAVGGPRTLYYLFLLPLGLLGLAAAAFRAPSRPWALCVGGLALGTTLVYAVGFPESRFRVPLEPLLAIAAAGLVRGVFGAAPKTPDAGGDDPSRVQGS